MTRLLHAIVLVLCWVGVAAAQPAGGPVVGQLLPYIRDAKLQQELRLAPEQVKALLAHRQQVWDEQLKTSPLEFLAGAATRALATRETFRKTLSAEQYDRAEQLATRLALRRLDRQSFDPTRVEARQLAAHPELAAALYLGPDQRKVVEAKLIIGVVFLTPQQTAALEKLLGPPPAAEWEAESETRDRPSAGAARTRRPIRVMVGSPDVQADLKLTAEQTKALTAVFTPPPDPATGKRPVLEPVAQLEERAWQLLTPAQQVRLRQLDDRLSCDISTPDGFGPVLLRNLTATPDQIRAIAAVRAAYAAAVDRAALSGDPPEVVGRAVCEAKAARDQAYHSALTADQRARLDTRFGEPFVGTFLGLDVQLLELLRNKRVASFGRYDNELSVITRNRAVRDELDITPERLKLIRTASTKAPRAPYPPTEDAAEAKSEHVGSTLAAFLTPAQQRRFRQIMLQERERPSADLVPRSDAPAAVAYPGVAEAVGLNDAQRASLLDGADPLEVLTPRQLASIRVMLGEPFRGPFGTGSEFAGSRKPGPRGAVLMELPWSAAAITPAQARTVADALNRFQVAVAAPAESSRPPFGKVQPATAPATPADALEKTLADAVTPEQVRRLDQLALQQAAGRDPRAVLTGFDAARLNLTQEQVEKLFELEQKLRMLMRALGTAELTPDHWRPLADRLRRRLDDQLLVVLTPAQRAAWSELTGEPCAEVRRPLPRLRVLGV